MLSNTFHFNPPWETNFMTLTWLLSVNVVQCIIQVNDDSDSDSNSDDSDKLLGKVNTSCQNR